MKLTFKNGVKRNFKDGDAAKRETIPLKRIVLKAALSKYSFNAKKGGIGTIETLYFPHN